KEEEKDLTDHHSRRQTGTHAQRRRRSDSDSDNEKMKKVKLTKRRRRPRFSSFRECTKLVVARRGKGNETWKKRV
ncbi:hypothetical protein PIB30_076720, partial [Stylosanthes scabra]|nr:hypothetical protein [Stylosanthes scabra]